MKKPVEPMPADHPMRVNVTEALRAYLLIDNALRSNPQSIRSSPPPNNEEGRNYVKLQKRWALAYNLLWEATDFEYEEDGFRNVCWQWRYWKVMARKCCWYQSNGYKAEPDLYLTRSFRLFPFEPGLDGAGETMRKLHEAEAAMAEACGLSELYKSPCSYLEQHFPNLKREAKTD